MYGPLLAVPVALAPQGRWCDLNVKWSPLALCHAESEAAARMEVP